MRDYPLTREEAEARWRCLRRQVWFWVPIIWGTAALASMFLAVFGHWKVWLFVAMALVVTLHGVIQIAVLHLLKPSRWWRD